MGKAIEALGKFAEGQCGYVTRGQAVRHDVTDVDLHRASTAGWMERAGRGVYRLAGVPPHPHEQLWVAWLQLAPSDLAYQRRQDPRSWVSHLSAAEVLELGDLPAWTHEFSTLTTRRTRREDVFFHRLDEPLARDMWTTVEGMPVARPPRIVADLLTRPPDGRDLDAGVQPADGGHVGRIALDALRRDLASRQEFLDALAGLDEDPAGLLDAMIEMAQGKFAA